MTGVYGTDGTCFSRCISDCIDFHVLQPSNGQVTDAHGGSPAAQPAAGTGGTQAGLLVDVAGEPSTDKPAARPTAQPAGDIDTAGAIPEDTFTKYDYNCFDNCQQIFVSLEQCRHVRCFQKSRICAVVHITCIIILFVDNFVMFFLPFYCHVVLISKPLITFCPCMLC